MPRSIVKCDLAILIAVQIEKQALNNIAYVKTVLHCDIACHNSGKMFLYVFDPS